jgi:hypothetical protein
MTHDQLTTKLRDPRQTMSIDAQTTMLDAADRLDRYREALIAARNDILETNQCCASIGVSYVDVDFIDEALK